MTVRIDFDKDVLKKALLSYGEKDLAKKVESVTQEQIKIIGDLAARHIGHHNLVDTTIALGAVEFFEGKSRPLKRKKRDLSFYKQTDPSEESRKKMKWWERIFPRKNKN